MAAQNRMRITDKSFSWPYSYSLPVDKNGPWYTLNTVGVGATLNIDLWGADRARVAAAIGEKNARQAETAGIELDLASSVAQLYFAMQATFQKIVLLQQLEEIARLSVQAHEHRTQRGVEDSVDIANAQAELLGAQQQVITARGIANPVPRNVAGADWRRRAEYAGDPPGRPAGVAGNAAGFTLLRIAGASPGSAGSARLCDRFHEPGRCGESGLLSAF